MKYERGRASARIAATAMAAARTAMSIPRFRGLAMFVDLEWSLNEMPAWTAAQSAIGSG
jgi:hypothetical protein